MLVGPLFHFPQCHSRLVSNRKEHVCPCHSEPEQVHDMTTKRVLGVFTLNCPQTGHWVTVDYYIVMNWTHVSVIVQYQNDGCSLSCTDDDVVWQSFEHLSAGCLTILKTTWRWVVIQFLTQRCIQLLRYTYIYIVMKLLFRLKAGLWLQRLTRLFGVTSFAFFTNIKKVIACYNDIRIQHISMELDKCYMILRM